MEEEEEEKNDERKHKLGGNNLRNQVFKKPVSPNKKEVEKEKRESLRRTFRDQQADYERLREREKAREREGIGRGEKVHAGDREQESK